jgi:glycosyltransferase involved in cell wall biosynthesis
MKEFIKTIKKESPAFVQVAGLQLDGFLTTIACKLAGVKVLVAVHGSSTQAQNISNITKRLMSILEYFTVKLADGIFGVSEYVSSWKICRCSKKLMGTVYNIVRIEEKQEKKTSIREELNISTDDIVIVSTGRITKDKGFDILWETIKKVGKRKNIKYLIVGEGSYKQTLFEEKENSEFKDDVILTGYRADVLDILNESDIFIICTKHETLCISLLEAAASGLPMVATNVGGIPEIVDSNCGILVENENSDEFADALITLISNKAVRESMGQSGKEKIKTVFNEKEIVLKLSKIYERMMKG